ncbi:porin [Flavobacterium sp.]|uniref:porin n=1 Tax=Flavobacterium sp. TaxID=239 RepID=UPI000EDADC65|nr:porin [Flavobacterium sp.]HCQ12969.1 porin [Flavobacterium sp.]
MRKKIYVVILLLFFNINLAQIASKIEEPKKVSQVENMIKKWYESISIRGYAQLRYNRLLETNSDLGCEQCDRSWGNNGGFFFRRGRIILSGQVHNRVFIYIQPDFASSAGTTNQLFQIRDAYFDLSLDKDREFRFRVGQSKVPYGFENMQSSQNRIALDRADAINSAVSNERDIGVFFYWATKEKRALFKKLIDDGLKGSGDYGLFGIGLYNGQTANRSEANNNQHIVARFSYPFEFKNGQVFEAGIQGYNGKYVVNTVSASSTGVQFQNSNPEFLDQRVAASVLLYPKPFGFQAEYNIGRGPEFNVNNKIIEETNLKGGYVQTMYMLKIKEQTLIPFAKYHWYDGGKKHELDARSYDVNDFEIGAEWQPFKNFELVADYTISSRRYEDATKINNSQKGNLLRLQVQFNF